MQGSAIHRLRPVTGCLCFCFTDEYAGTFLLLVVLQMWQMVIGGEMVLRTAPAMQSLEGWLDMEAHESDLRGQRSIFLTGSLFALMGLLNFGHTVATYVQKSYRRRRPRKTEQGSKGTQSKLQ